MNIFAESLIGFVLSLLSALSFASTGGWVLGRAGIGWDDPLEELVFAFGTGLFVVATVLWLGGILGFFGPALGFICVVPGIFLGLLPSGLLKKLAKISIQVSHPRAWVVFVLIMGVLTTLTAFSPLMGNDAQAYHMDCAKRFVSQGSLALIPYNPNASQPFLIQMIYAYGLFFDNAVIGKFFNLWLYAGLCILVYYATRRLGGVSAARWSIVLIMLVPGLSTQASLAYSDIALTFFFALSAQALHFVFNRQDRKFLYLCFFFCGCAFAVKLLAVQTFLAMICVMGVVLTLKRLNQIAPRNLTVFYCMLFFLVPFMGWYIRSWCLTGNPVFPYAQHWFSDKAWASDVAVTLGFPKQLSFIPLSWIGVFVNPNKFFAADTQLGPVLLGLLPFVGLSGRLSRVDKIIFFTFIFMIGIVWFCMAQAGRFLLPLAWWLCVYGAVALDELWGERKTIPARCAIAAIGTALFLQTALIFYYNAKKLDFFKADSTKTYIQSKERAAHAGKAFQAYISPGEEVLVANENRLYYLPGQSRRWEMVLRYDEKLASLKGAVETAKYLKELGFSKLIFRVSDDEKLAMLTDPRAQVVEKLAETRFNDAEGPSRYALYQIL